MNDFDRFLEIELERMLDPIVGAHAPARRPGRRRRLPLLEAVTAPIERAAEVITVAEPAAVPVPVTPSR